MKQEALASFAVETTRREDVCALLGEPYDPEHWNDWRWQMRHRFTRLEQFERLLALTESERRGLMLASEKFSVAVTPHFATLIEPDDPDCPIRFQQPSIGIAFCVSVCAHINGQLLFTACSKCSRRARG